MQDIPIVRIELEHMKHSLKSALAAHTNEINNMIQDAVDSYCTVDNLQRIIFEQAKADINSAIKQEVQRFYLYGKGREVIREAVSKQLEDENDI